MLTLLHSLILIATVLGTSVLSGVFGMAGGLILMGVLASIFPVPLAMAAHGFAQFIANGTRFSTLARHVNWRGTAFYAAGTALAASLLWFVSFSPSRPLLFFFLGGIPIISLLPITPKLDFQKPTHALICGLLNTGAHLTAGVSGPLLDLFFVNSKMNRFEIIATKAFTQTLGHALKIGYFSSFAISLTDLPIWLPIGVAISAVGGTHIGGWILRRMNDASFRLYLRWIFLAIGCTYLLRGAWELWGAANI